MGATLSMGISDANLEKSAMTPETLSEQILEFLASVQLEVPNSQKHTQEIWRPEHSKNAPPQHGLKPFFSCEVQVWILLCLRFAPIILWDQRQSDSL